MIMFRRKREIIASLLTLEVEVYIFVHTEYVEENARNFQISPFFFLEWTIWYNWNINSLNQ